MLRVNYKRPEEMLSHHRDFPERSDGERLRAYELEAVVSG